jgi:hypothetical protein
MTEIEAKLGGDDDILPELATAGASKVRAEDSGRYGKAKMAGLLRVSQAAKAA